MIGGWIATSLITVLFAIKIGLSQTNMEPIRAAVADKLPDVNLERPDELQSQHAELVLLLTYRKTVVE